jgi:hypothetical protein
MRAIALLLLLLFILPIGNLDFSTGQGDAVISTS